MRDRGVREVISEARRQGWTDETNKGHTKLRAPNGRLVVISTTPRDPRTLMNVISDMRRQGFIWKGR